MAKTKKPKGEGSVGDEPIGFLIDSLPFLELDLPELLRNFPGKAGVLFFRPSDTNPYSNLADSLRKILSNVSKPTTPLLTAGLPMDIRTNSRVLDQQNIIRGFLFENSGAMGNVPMPRLLPVFLYLEERPSFDLIESIGLALDCRSVEAFPTLTGSWFARLFFLDPRPFTAKEFWDEHGRLDVLTLLLNRIGGISGVIALAGVMWVSKPVRNVQASTAPDTVHVAHFDHHKVDLTELQRYIAQSSTILTAQQGRDSLERLGKHRAPTKRKSAKKKAARIPVAPQNKGRKFLHADEE